MKKNNTSRLEEVNLFLSHLENKYKLYDIQIEGWCVWPIIRSYVGSELLNLNWDADKKSGQKMSLPAKVSHIIKNALYLLRLSKAPILVKTFTAALRGQHGGYYKDIFVDDLLLQLKKSDFVKIGTMANTTNFSIYLERNQHAMVPEDADSYILEAIASGLSRLYVPRSVHNAAKAISNMLEKEDSIRNLPAKRILRLLSIYYWTKLLYRRLISHVSPAFVLVPNHSQYSFTAAAKEAGACVIEMQHGSPNHLKLPYSWPDFADSYKDNLPLPDKIFLFGDHFKEDLMQNGFWNEELISVGSLQFDAHRNVTVAKNASSLNILVTTQGIDAHKICNLLDDFLKLTAGSVASHIYIKLHPNYDNNKKIYGTRLRNHANISILQNSEGATLYELFHIADCHLSIYSTTHFESLALGVPTLILPFSGHEQMLPLVNKGHANIVHSAEALTEYLTSKQEFRVPREVRDYYFRADTVINIRRELKLEIIP